MHVRFIRTLLFSLVLLCMSAASFAQVGVGVVVNFAPPPLPVYEQPLCPGEGYIWTPGYWAYGDDFDDYYWVPGTWVMAPEIGFLWTPAYWGWGGEGFVFYDGYWGPVVGFYGGINYGFGYTGVGFAGGYWRGREYNYNRSVTNINVVNVHNTYNTTVINNNTTVNRVSFNGGAGGTSARVTAAEEHAAHEHHFEATPAQTQHQHFASTNHEQLASINHGHPNVAASPKPGVYSGHGVVSANNNTNFQKFSRNNTSPSGGSGPNTGNTFTKTGNGVQSNATHGNAPQGGKVKSTDTIASHGNSPHNNGGTTHHSDVAVKQNGAGQNSSMHNNAMHNNEHTNNAHVNSNAHVHEQNAGQHSNAHTSHTEKH